MKIEDSFIQKVQSLSGFEIVQGIINGLSIKSSNHSILPLKEEILKIRIQNFNQNIQSIPIGMPIGRIVVQSKNFWEL